MRTGYRSLLGAAAFAFVASLVVSVALAEEAKPGADTVRVHGVVKVTTNDAKEVTAITITMKTQDKETVYNVVLDENGKKLAAENGKTVMVRGTVAEKEGVKNLTVVEYKVVEPRKEGEKK
jgi:uncharacterized membrane protein